MSQREYSTFNYPGSTGGKTLLTGIRGVENDSKEVYISGWYESPNDSQTTAFVYKGNIFGTGQFYPLSYPSASRRTVTATSLYGPNNGRKGNIRVVGNYVTAENENSAIGCLYEGPLNGTGEWTTLIPSTLTQNYILNTIAHSTHGDLIVGNYDIDLMEGKAFIYDIKKKNYVNIVKDNAKSITAYGVWKNKKNHYTICGGYSDLDAASGLDSGYLVDYSRKSQKFSNWRSYSYNNNPAKSIVTHFDGITSDNRGGYNLTGIWTGPNQTSHFAFFAHVKRNKHDKFKKKALWEEVSYPNSLVTSGNSVYLKVVIGVYINPDDDTVYGYTSYK